MVEFYVRIQIDVPVFDKAQATNRTLILDSARDLLAADDFLEQLVDGDGEDAAFEDLPQGYQDGDMCGKLPGTGRNWEIVQESERKFEVWYDGCEHGGTFRSYKAAIESVRPTEMGD